MKEEKKKSCKQKRKMQKEYNFFGYSLIENHYSFFSRWSCF